MAKRKKKSDNSPNIPQDVLDRARAEVAAGGGDDIAETSEEARRKAERRAERAARRAARRQRQSSREAPPKPDELGAAAVAEMLANPTTEVNPEELKVQYSYVLADLRNMGILAAVLFLVLIALGFLL